MNKRFPNAGGGEQLPSPVDKRTHFREALRIGAQLHLEDRLWIDAQARDRLLDDPTVSEVPKFVKISFTNALSTMPVLPDVIDIRDIVYADELEESELPTDQGLMQATLTTCLTNPTAVMARFGKKKYHENLFIHIPYRGLTIPRTYEDIQGLPEPEVIFLEYRRPKLSRNKSFVGFETIRYAVSENEIAPYTSYEAGEEQHDEFDLLEKNPETFFLKYLSDIAASSTAMKAIETWDETPLGQLKR